MTSTDEKPEVEFHDRVEGTITRLKYEGAFYFVYCIAGSIWATNMKHQRCDLRLESILTDAWSEMMAGFER